MEEALLRMSTTNNPNEDSPTKLLPAASHATRVMGRHLIHPDNGTIRIDWPGVRLYFEGFFTQTTSIRLRVKGNGLVLGYRLSPIDNESTTNNSTEEQEFAIVTSQADKMQDYTLTAADSNSNTADLDPNKSYTLTLWKRDDPYNGGMEIAGLVVDRTCLVTPDPQVSSKRKLIEFVGDSNTAGFGISAKLSGFFYHFLCQMPCLELFNGPQNLLTTSDATKSWAPQLAHKLNADYHIIAWSGIGVKYSVLVEANTNMTQAYTRIIASDPDTHLPQLPGPSPDAVIVYIGQNDTVNVSDPTKLQQAFSELLLKIRQYRPPPIPILIVVPTSEAKLACVWTDRHNHHKATTMNTVWKAVVQDMDQPHYCHVVENNHDPPIPHIRSPQDYGMLLHWNVSANQKWANGLFPKVKDILGWD